MAKKSSHILELARRGAQARLQDLTMEAKLLLQLFPDLTDSFEKDELPISFIIAKDSGRLTRGNRVRLRTMSPAARRAIGQRMKAHRGGSIVTVGWDQAETGMEGDSGELFAATKGAIMAFTRSLARSLAPSVRVNALAPGWIKTAWGESASYTWQQRALRETPLARWGTPDDVARAARFLVGPDAAFLTGQVLRVNGGAIR